MVEEDRRQYSRKEKRNNIAFYCVEKGSKQIYLGKVIDGSQGGIRFRVEKSLPKNARLYVRLDSEEWEVELNYFSQDDGLEVVEMIASVMWCLESDEVAGEFEVGARFIGYTEQ